MDETNQFTYTVKMSGDLRLLVKDDMADIMDNTHELVISSGIFIDYEACIDAVSRLLSGLSLAVSLKNGRQYVIVTKKNPLFESEPAEPNETGWDRFTILRLYVADAEILKEQSKLSHLAVAEVKVAEYMIDLIKSRTISTQQ